MPGSGPHILSRTEIVHKLTACEPELSKMLPKVGVGAIARDLQKSASVLDQLDRPLAWPLACPHRWRRIKPKDKTIIKRQSIVASDNKTANNK